MYVHRKSNLGGVLVSTDDSSQSSSLKNCQVGSQVMDRGLSYNSAENLTVDHSAYHH